MKIFKKIGKKDKIGICGKKITMQKKRKTKAQEQSHPYLEFTFGTKYLP